MTEIRIEDLRYIATGAAILGAGGGGDPLVGRLMAEHAIAKCGPVRVIGADQLDDSDLVIPSAMMGAPAVMLEKLPSGNEPEVSFRALEKIIGKKAAAVVPIEAGGLNSCIPIYTAAVLGLPLVDADGMGRAFPELPMVSFGIGGVSATPMVMSDEKGNTVVIDAIDNAWSEILSRPVTIAMGLAAMLAIYPMDGAALKKLAIRNTVSLAYKIGKALDDTNQALTSPVEVLCEVTGGFRLFTGKIVDVTRDMTTGFLRGEAGIDGLGDDDGATFRVEFQNENLVAWNGDRLVAATPDLITVIDAETAGPVTTENLQYGRRVHVIGIPCDPFWRSTEALAQVGPRYFAYDVDYQPIEHLVEGVNQ